MFAAANVMRAAQDSGFKLAWTSLDPRLTFARASTATRVNSAGLIVSAANDAPRFDYDSATLALKGLLIEEQRTNEVKYSEDLTNAAWTSSTSPNTTVIATSGGFTTISFSAASADRRCPRGQQPLGFTITDGQVVTLRARFRPGAGCQSIALGYLGTGARFGWAAYNIATGASSAYNLSNAAVASFVSATQVSPGVWELVVQITGAPATAVGIMAHFGGNDTAQNMRFASPIASCDIGFVQLEQAAFPTSYIPTTASAVTRAADVCSATHTDFIQWLGRTEKTVVVGAASPASGTRRVFHATKTGSETTDYISIWTSDTTVKATVVAGGVTQADLTLGTIAAGVPFKVALRVAAKDIEASLNGAAKVTDVSATVPACDKAWFGCGPAGNQLCGHLSGTWEFLNSLGDVQALAA